MTDLASTSLEEQRCLLRGNWQLASVFHFLNAFRSVLNLKLKFSMEELETALLAPNALLDDIHIGLLKAIPPNSRNPLNQETWIAVLCKKLKDWWNSVAEGSFPLVPQQGEELATYRKLTADVRAMILKALCEARLDQEDMRGFIGEMAKQEASFLCIRKERTGTDMQGATYWYENDPVAGQRLYREQKSDRNKTKLRGQLVSPPATSEWETLATNLDEFQSVVDKLCSSRNKMEVGLGKKIDVDILPDLINAEKRKQRMMKKQLRQAGLLENNFSIEGVAISRSRRERKPVSYTFDDFDNSIDEALEVMGEGCVQEPQNFTKTDPSDETESDAEELSGYDSEGATDCLQEKKRNVPGSSRGGAIDMEEETMGSGGEGQRNTWCSQKRRMLAVMEEPQEGLGQVARGTRRGDGCDNNESIAKSNGSEDGMTFLACSHKERSTIEEGDAGWCESMSKSNAEEDQDLQASRMASGTVKKSKLEAIEDCRHGKKMDVLLKLNEHGIMGV